MLTIDTGMFGKPNATAAYLVEGSTPALIDSGSAVTVPEVLEALRFAGDVEPAAIVLTHLHLDHAGGAGHIAARFPEAQIYIHERVARHLADPSRVIAGSRQVWGDNFDSWFGEPMAIDPVRITAVNPGDRIAAGDSSLLAVDAPGHTRAQLAFLDEDEGLLACGDAMGIQLPGSTAFRPATPPSDFDFETAVGTIETIGDLQPQRLMLGHFGEAGPGVGGSCELAIEALRRWQQAVVERSAHALDETDLVRQIHAALEAGLEPAGPAIRARFEAVNPAWLNVAGISQSLSRQTAAQP
jgi:glyoxylase-like metal-dependent hydrolase (beta-lactamase superfamily II)